MFEGNKPMFITFTGADEFTSVDMMRSISHFYPVEWGILFSPKRQGIDPRYPGKEMVLEIIDAKLSIAAHLCGKHSSEVMKGNLPDVPVDLRPFQRVQINTNKLKLARVMQFQERIGRRCIGQVRGEAFPKSNEIGWLFDVSGGRGEAPAAWPKYPGHAVGYAGGLGPKTVLGALEAIDAQGLYWIDMESGVRTDDRFDLAKCWEVCHLVYGTRKVM